MNRLASLACACLTALALPVLAQQPPPEVAAYFDAPNLQGSARVRAMGFRLYDAELWTPRNGFRPERPFALSLTYKRTFSARQLVDATIKEVARIEGQRPADHKGLEKLMTCFADVRPGDRITGVSQGADQASFYVNGARSCRITYPRFSKRFFGIWLGPATRDPGARRLLLAGN